MADEMTPLRHARHALRGKMNILKLCASVLPMCDSPSDAVEYLQEIEQNTDGLIAALDEYERLLDAESQKP